jgi:cobalamin biosynthesis Mg chelatase CobN
MKSYRVANIICAIVIFTLLCLAFASCKTVSKTTVTEKTDTKQDSTWKQNNVSAELIDSTRKITAAEIAFIIGEGETVKEITVDSFTTDGKVIKRTTTKERSKNKTSEKKETLTSDSRQVESEKYSANKGEGSAKSSTSTLNKNKDVKKTGAGLTSVWIALLVILVLYLVYRYVRYKYTKPLYPF